MNKRIFMSALFILIASFGIFSHVVFAQTASSTASTTATSTTVAAPKPTPVQTTSASAYSCPSYGQEIVKVTLVNPSTRVLAGATLPIKIKLQNQLNYPLAGGSVLVRVFSNKLSDKTLTTVAPVMIDRFFPLTSINLPAKGSKEQTFSLDLREKLPTGTYTVLASYVVSSQFNVENPDSDLDKISGSNAAKLELTVTAVSSNNTSIVYFDKKSLTQGAPLNGIVTAKIDLVNTSAKAVTVPVLWKQYYWNAVSNDTFVKSSVVSVDVPAKGRKSVSYEINNSNHSLYEVIGAVDMLGVQSLVSFDVEGAIGESIVQSLNITPFPWQNGKNTTVFGCVNNTFSNDVNTGNLFITVTNVFEAKETLLDRVVLAVKPGWQFDFSKEFASNAARNIRVSADIFSLKGPVIQHFELLYTCADFSDKCPIATPTTTPTTLPEVSTATTNIPYKGIALLGGGVLGAILIAVILRRRRGGVQAAPVAPTAPASPVAAIQMIPRPVTPIVPQKLPVTSIPPMPPVVPVIPPAPPVPPTPIIPPMPPTTNLS